MLLGVVFAVIKCQLFAIEVDLELIISSSSILKLCVFVQSSKRTHRKYRLAFKKIVVSMVTCKSRRYSPFWKYIFLYANVFDHKVFWIFDKL